MSSATIATISRMVEELPEVIQGQVADHLREYIQSLQDEMKWDETFQRTESQLAAAAQRARQEIENEQATQMDYQQL